MIREPYALLTRIPLYEDIDGFYTDDLWEKDLSAHLRYISDFRICCPVEPVSAATGPLKRVTGLADAQIFPLRIDRGWGSVVANILPNFSQVARAVRGSEIVHSGCAGWAFPLAYYVLLLRPFRRFKWINVVESSFWIKPASGPVSARQWIEHHVHEFMVRRCVRASDARIFTQDWYRETYLGSSKAALVAPAVWLDENDLRADADLAAAHAEDCPVRLIFPARLEAEKGVDAVLAAVARWEERFGRVAGPSLQIDIVGEGALAERCRQYVAARPEESRLQMRFLDPVPYGEPFFALLRGYDAAIVANRQAEQARIVFDVMSQGLTCLASDTTGNIAVIAEGDTGAIFPVDDADALAGLFDHAAHDPSALRAMGQKALAAARGYSHAAMHAQREVFLRDTLQLSQ
jgi:glycosyltransferase involved in cell wall biosynthesis